MLNDLLHIFLMPFNCLLYIFWCLWIAQEDWLFSHAISSCFLQGLPSWFMKKYENKIRERAVLLCQSSIWTVKVIIHTLYSKYVSVRFGSGWRDFATYYGLLEGDTLLFSLTADSNFKVYLKAGQPVRKRACDSKLAQKKEKTSCRLSKLHLVKSVSNSKFYPIFLVL